jgi:hypothetical protein
MDGGFVSSHMAAPLQESPPQTRLRDWIWFLMNTVLREWGGLNATSLVNLVIIWQRAKVD